ncbi:MAG TPA: hypothetical protein VLV50_03695 [Stellaceae bacterium]|nr:hypothetical protein [Stellaceae bacterium]
MTQRVNTFLVFVAACIACFLGYSYARGGRTAEDAAVHQCLDREITAGTLTINSEQICRAAIRREHQLS